MSRDLAGIVAGCKVTAYADDRGMSVQIVLLVEQPK